MAVDGEDLRDCCVGTCLVCGGCGVCLCATACVLGLVAGVSAGSGALCGLVGWQVVRAAGWKSVAFGCSQLVGANALGSAILSVPFGGCSTQLSEQGLRVNINPVRACVWQGVTNALSAMCGSAILGLTAEDQIGFAVAAGATGGVILSLGVGALAYSWIRRTYTHNELPQQAANNSVPDQEAPPPSPPPYFDAANQRFFRPAPVSAVVDDHDLEDQAAAIPLAPRYGAGGD